MIQSNLVFVFDGEGENILLCMKKRGFGVGKWNGPGGKVGLDETILEGAKRELSEETGIDIPQEELEYRGILHFFHHGKPEWDQDVNIFVHHGYTGEFYETEEMLPKWYPISEIPYDKMWEDDNTWLPILISGEEFEFTFKFGENGKIIEGQRHK